MSRLVLIIDEAVGVSVENVRRRMGVSLAELIRNGLTAIAERYQMTQDVNTIRGTKDGFVLEDEPATPAPVVPPSEPVTPQVEQTSNEPEPPVPPTPPAPEPPVPEPTPAPPAETPPASEPSSVPEPTPASAP